MEHSLLRDARQLMSDIEKVTASAVTFQEMMSDLYARKEISLNEYADTLSIYPRLRDARTSINLIIALEEVKIANAAARDSEEAERHQGTSES